jgi:cysteine desulfurase/selenocysteine lyase
MNIPDPRHAAATAPAASPQAPQWGGQGLSVIDPGLIAHIANALLNATPGQTPDPHALANFAATQERPVSPPTSVPGAIGAAAAVPGTSIPGGLAFPLVTESAPLPIDPARAPAQHVPAAALASGITGVPAGAAAPPAPAVAGHDLSPEKGQQHEPGLRALPNGLGHVLSFVPAHVPAQFSLGLPSSAALPAEALYFLDGTSAGAGLTQPTTMPDAHGAPELPRAGSLQSTPLEQPLNFDSLVPAEKELRPQELSDLSALPSATFPAGFSHESVSAAPASTGELLYFVNESEAAAGKDAPGHTNVSGLGTWAPEITPALSPDLLSGTRAFDVHAIKRDFPILHQKVHGKPLIWLDNAATTQKPQAVIDRVALFYENENSNIHRGAHALAARATDAYEASREKVRRFLGAASANDIVFTRGATEAINLVAQAWGRRNMKAGDEIVITWLEHHANIVPWQMLCADTGAILRVAPVDDSGQILLNEYAKLLSHKTKLVALPQVSNALGTVTPAQEMVAVAHRHGACVLVDGAQAVSHMPLNVQSLDCDFYVFSGHKVFAPTGIGVLYGKPDILAAMPPWQGGGNMIADVTFERTIYHAPPLRFEAGTGNIADAVGLGAAIDYLDRIGMANIAAYEHGLLGYATQQLQTIPGLTIIGTAAEKAGVISFILGGCRSEDVGAALDREGIAVRAGHHCAQPILRRFGLESTVRPSLALYNTQDDIDMLVEALQHIQCQKKYRAVSG